MSALLEKSAQFFQYLVQAMIIVANCIFYDGVVWI